MSNFKMGSISDEIKNFLEEDGCFDHFRYYSSLPDELVESNLYIKSDLVLAGLPFFVEVFKALGCTGDFTSFINSHEGQFLNKGYVLSIPVKIPWGIAVTGERVALNILQRCSAIATTTAAYVQKANKLNIKILDTRKTTPGFRKFEKYAVKSGGGFNHRFNQVDQWMVKDNHKTFFGGIEGAVNFFNNIGEPYKNIIVEVHSEEEFLQAKEMGIRYMMLDNFTPEKIITLLKKKEAWMFIEVSGGINLENIDQFLLPGIDAISVGKLTQFPPAIDISFKYQRCLK